MTDTLQMLKSHASPVSHVGKLAACIDACATCIITCNACADACLGEPDPKKMARCIRTDLDCAAACTAAAAVLCRQTEPDYTLIRAQVQAMQTACRQCGDECKKHADRMEHCRICAEACRECEQACKDLLSALPA